MELLQLAAGAELRSEHHIGEAIIAHARELRLALEEPDEFIAIAGHGIQARFQAFMSAISLSMISASGSR